MHRRTFLGLGALLLVNKTSAADAAGEALDGLWLVSVSGDPRERVLAISGTAMEGGRVRAANVRYGWVNVRQPAAVTDFSGTVAGDLLQLRFHTNANSLIEVELHTGEQALAGTFTSASGKQAAVRMTRISEDELAALQNTGSSQPGATGRYPEKGPLVATSASRITLIYIGASNCPACRGYEAEYFGPMDKMRLALPEFGSVRYTVVKLGGFRGIVRDADLPDDLAWAAGERPNGKPVLRNHGTPFFAAVVDRQIWGQAHGVSGLEAVVLPQIRLALKAQSQHA